MTPGQEIKAAFDYRRTMRDYLESGAIIDGADDWIRMELHNQEREMRGEVAAVLRLEYVAKAEQKSCPRCSNSEIRESDRFCKICGLKLQAEMKRPAGQGESGLRGRLKHLISSILAQREVKRNA